MPGAVTTPSFRRFSPPQFPLSPACPSFAPSPILPKRPSFSPFSARPPLHCHSASHSPLHYPHSRTDFLSQVTIDAFLSAMEIVCIAPPVICSIGCLCGAKAFLVVQSSLGSNFWACQCVFLATALAIGSSIRWRQWRRLSKVSGSGLGVDLFGRIEKVEEELRSSATIMQMLSRHLEKLGIRFRVTRRVLKDPIAETAALAQKNFKATEALALREDLLEQELSEMQKVLLAMQEQQQKQLELILALGKSMKVLDGRRIHEQYKATGHPDISKQKKDLGAQSESPIGGNNRAS